MSSDGSVVAAYPHNDALHNKFKLTVTGQTAARCRSSHGNLKLARSQDVSTVASGTPRSHWVRSALVETSTDVGHRGYCYGSVCFGPEGLRETRNESQQL